MFDSAFKEFKPTSSANSISDDTSTHSETYQHYHTNDNSFTDSIANYNPLSNYLAMVDEAKKWNMENFGREW